MAVFARLVSNDQGNRFFLGALEFDPDFRVRNRLAQHGANHHPEDQLCA